MNTKVDTKTRILDAAQLLILTEGFHGASVDTLIEKAGISKGSFFYHFRSKDDLPQALLNRLIESHGKSFQEVIANALALDIADTEKAYIIADETAQIFCQTLSEYPGCLMAAFSYQLIADFPEVRSTSEQAIKGFSQKFGEVFEVFAQDAKKGVTGEQLAQQFFTVMQGSFIVARIQNNSDAILQAVKQFKLYLQLLLPSTQP